MLAAEVGGYGTHVDVGPSRTDGGGGALGRVLIVGHNGAFTFRAGARGLIGGGSGGFATRLAGDLSGGPALELDDEKHVRLFARLGLDLSTTKDDTLDASLFSVPSAVAGMMFSFERFVLELGPRGGLALRSDFEPGAEYQGLRHHRRSVVRPDWGASLAMLTTFMTAHASAYRVEERAGLWHADGSMCGVAFAGGSAPAFFFCANGQLWKGEVRDALGVSREATAASLGLSVAIGVVEIKNGKDR